MSNETNNLLTSIFLGLGIFAAINYILENLRPTPTVPETQERSQFVHNPAIAEGLNDGLGADEGCVIFLQTPYGVLPFAIDAAQLQMARQLALAEGKPVDVILCEVLAERIEIARNLDL